MLVNQIQTAQNVSIARNNASIVKRGLAFLIDFLIYICYWVASSWFLSLTSLDNSLSNSLLSIVYTVPILLYHILFEVFNNGQSIGKASLRIRVVKTDGSQPDLGSLLIRWLLRILDITLTFGGLAIVMILLNRNAQRLGDLAARTCVIDENPKIGYQQTLIANIPYNHKPKYEQVRTFSDKDMQKVKKLFNNAEKTQNHKIKIALARKLSEKMRVDPDEKPHDFIKRVLTDYIYYTSQDQI
jgi:uncharacterized RDD family membrane protein YckC